MEQDDDKKQLKARTIVERLLKFRLRSEQEIRDKLNLKHIPDDIIEDTVTYFKELGVIDDRQFTQKWIVSRLNRPFGSRRIQQELIQKGVHRGIITDEIERALQNYGEEDVVLALAKARRMKYTGLDPQKVKQRLYGYLSRRGFNPAIIYKTLKKLR